MGRRISSLMWLSKEIFRKRRGWEHSVAISLQKEVNGRSAFSAPSSPIHLADIMTRRKQVAGRGGVGEILWVLRTKCRSQWGARFPTRRNKLSKLLRNLAIERWGKTEEPSAGEWKAVTALRVSPVKDPVSLNPTGSLGSWRMEPLRYEKSEENTRN